MYLILRSTGSTEVALEVAGRAEQQIITEAAPNELKLGEGAYSDESGPSARRWRRGCSSGVVCENHLVGSELLSKRTHTSTHTFPCRISVGEAFRSSASKGILMSQVDDVSLMMIRATRIREGGRL